MPHLTFYYHNTHVHISMNSHNSIQSKLEKKKIKKIDSELVTKLLIDTEN